MPDIQYLNENLLPRQLGHAAIILSFVTALLATIAYFIATQKDIHASKISSLEGQKDDITEGVSANWLRIGRWSFGVHSVAIWTIIASIFYVMINKRFEYFYAHSHVDTDLPFRYVFAAFWEGQEGSFLLWMFWHVALGGFIILQSRPFSTKNNINTWEKPVIATLCCVQVFLSSMILGLHFGFGEHIIKWGSNPILLLRETMDAPMLFNKPDYVSKLATSAKGLNPLLQNYWMTIHPPTLFLGFASTTIPFCFAIAGLWTKKYTEWLKPAFKWSLFSATILGTGVLMGGAWAYEALSFNGYWAWDPVENMSLVPWIILIAGIHTHLITRATGHSLKSTFLFYILTFLFVLYSTFLTRSGILGDTSVHAFTELGLEWQLVLLQFFFIGLGAWFFIKNFKKIPTPPKEESVASREFWLFIGSLVLMLSVVLMSFTTSIPVFNKILTFFNPSAKTFTAPVDVIAHYNMTQLWIGVSMGLLSAITQYLRFKEANFPFWKSTFIRHTLVASGITLGLTFLSLSWINTRDWQHGLLLFSGIFTVVSNLDYLFVFMKNNIKAAGSVFSHVGFGVLIVGIMASGINKRWISSNRFVMESMIDFSEEQFAKNVLLIKGAKLPMNGFVVSYDSDTSYLNRRDFTLTFRKMAENTRENAQTNKSPMAFTDSFVVHPYVLFDKKTGKLTTTNPDNRHFLTYDIFSYLAALPPTEQDPKVARQFEDSLHYHDMNLAVNETISPVNENGKTPQYRVRLDGINPTPKHQKYVAEQKDLAIGVKLTFFKGKDSVFTAEPLVLLRGENIYQLPVTINELGIRVKGGTDIFDKLLEQRKDLIFKEYVFSQGQTQKIGGRDITFQGVEAATSIENFPLEPNDLAFKAKIAVHTEGGDFEAKPVFVIRGNQPIPLKDNIAALGLTFAIGKVNPQTKQMTIEIAQNPPSKLPISIAENAPRTDYVVLEATVNPGINFVWLGCIMMLFGLGLAMVNKIRNN